MMSDPFDGVKRIYGKPVDFSKLKRTVEWRINMAEKQKDVAERLAHFTSILDSCPICKCEQIKPFVTIYSYNYYECINCGHIFLQTLPDYELVEKLYSSPTGEERNLQETIYLSDEIFKNRVKMIAAPKVDFVNSIVDMRGLWIDIGCGVGEILQAANDEGWEALGYEIDPREIEFGRNIGLNINNTKITESNAGEFLSRADIISLFNMIEHIEKPLEFLKIIVDSVKNNAYIVLEVPRHPSLSSFSSLAFPYIASRHIYPPDHLHIFTEKGIKYIFDNIGLEAVGIWSFGQDFYDIIMNVAANAKLHESCLLEQIILASQKMQKHIDESGLSDTLIIIAKKNAHQGALCTNKK